MHISNGFFHLFANLKYERRILSLLCEHAYENHCFQQIKKCGHEFHDKTEGRYKKVILQKDCPNSHLNIA